MHKFEVNPGLRKKLIKIYKKDKNLHEKIMKKMDQVIKSENIEHYKNLRYDMKDSKRTHIGHFVLVFRYGKSKDLISFEDFRHHDDIYR
ncbi:MAG: addiction module toxin RelE [Nanoarchaeota archaeon]|nr:addiction module toxin RelE [Nanoarchaeota archaeon]